MIKFLKNLFNNKTTVLEEFYGSIISETDEIYHIELKSLTNNHLLYGEIKKEELNVGDCKNFKTIVYETKNKLIGIKHEKIIPKTLTKEEIEEIHNYVDKMLLDDGVDY